MKIANILSRNVAATCGLLFLAGAGQLAAQVGTALTSNNIAFAHQRTSLTAPAPQTIRVLSNPSSLSFTATATVTSGTAWLLVNGGISATGTTGTSTQDIQINVNALGLAVGTYTGSVSVNVTGATANIINVTLTVSDSPQVTVSPSTLILTGQVGQQTLTNVTVNSTGTGAAIPFTANVTATSPGGAWLTVSPATGNTGSPVTIVANPLAFSSPATIAVGTITFTSAAGSMTLPVTFTVGGSVSTLTVNPTSTTIGFQLGTAAPASRQITVTSSSGATVQYTAQVTAGTWLTLSPFPTSAPGTIFLSGTTPNPFYAVANPAGLATGEYQGRILVTSPSIVGGSQEVTVRLVVSTSPILVSTPESITFNHTVGTTPPGGQLLSITSGQSLQFQATATTASGGDWLVVSPAFGTTNQVGLTVSLNATRLIQLAAGTYAGTISIAAAGAANTPHTIPVTLNVSGSTLINVNPAQLEFNTQAGQTPLAQSFAVTSTDGSNQAFNISLDPASTSWLIVSPTSGFTGSTGVLVNVNVIPGGLAAGTHEATIVITPAGVPGAVPQRLPVKLNILGSATVTANPTRLDFTQTGGTAPAAQTVTLTSTVSNLTYLAQGTQPWITVTPSSGTITPTGTALSIGVNSTGLTAGQTYEGAVNVSVSGVTTLSIPVRFQYQSAAALTVSPTTLSFNFQTGGQAPAAQNIALTSSGVAISFTAAAATTPAGGTWLSVNPTSGTTAATGGAATNIAVSVNPTGLAPGTYNGTVTITGQNATNSPQTVNVTLVVTAVATPVIRSVDNAASNAATSLSPGLLVAIKGSNLGPATGVGGQVQGGRLTTQLSDVQVLFDNIAAPLTFVRQDQVNAIVPYAMANRTSSRVVVQYRGVRSDPIDIRVVETAPGLFTADSTGRGQGAFLNQDNSVNAPNNPAARGSVIVLYATGEGAVIPAGMDGEVITAATLKRPFAAVSVRIGGMPAQVQYAGSAPGLVSGALQVNALIPANLAISTTTPVPVELTIGNATSAITQTVMATIRP